MTTKDYTVTSCKVCQIGLRSSGMDWWMMVSLKTEFFSWIAFASSHSIFTHFPKDRNCDICLRTKITRASCRKRTGTVVPRVDILVTWQLRITKFSVKAVNRNNHRHAVVVQDLATQWIQSHPCKTKTSQETQKRLQKFLELTRKPKVIYTDNWWRIILESLYVNTAQIGNPWVCEEGSAQNQGRDICGLDEKWWADSMDCYCYLRSIQDLLSDGKTPYERRFGVPFNGPVIPFGAMVEYHPHFGERPIETASFWS